jgi:NhaA family Na+:H+ antiporter
VALVWANSPWAHSYERLWNTPLGLRIGYWAFERSLVWFVNDALMVVFFFVVGLEIRRELHHGELSEWRRAAVPCFAALGGMIAPAGLYLSLANTPPLRVGWGVPMATDIAFALGILALLGRRVPAALRVLLLALAVIDDLGAIVVIALFYSQGLAFGGVAIAAAGLLGVLAMQRLGVRAKLAYVVPGAVLWAGVYAAGVHPTIAGVVLGIMTPVRAWLGTDGFIADVRQRIDALASNDQTTHTLATTLRQVNVARREALSPAEGLIEVLHPWVAFGIMPIFALANAGVSLAGTSLNTLSTGASLGVFVGLVVGKPLGVLTAVWLARRVGLGVLPMGIGVRQLVVLGLVAGIGFTMSIFIAQLAFADARALAAAKLGVLVASFVTAVLTVTMGRLLLEGVRDNNEAVSADEAESETER